MSDGHRPPENYVIEVVGRSLDPDSSKFFGGLPFTSLHWGRTQDNASQATIRVPREMLDLAEPITCWRHGVLIFRDGALVWCGPIISASLSSSGREVVVTCVDPAGQWATKLLQSDINYVRRPDRDTATPIPGQTEEGYDLQWSHGYFTDGAGFNWEFSEFDFMTHAATHAAQTDPAPLRIPPGFMDADDHGPEAGGFFSVQERSSSYLTTEGRTIPEWYREKFPNGPWAYYGRIWGNGGLFYNNVFTEADLEDWDLTIDAIDVRNELFYLIDGYIEGREDAIPAIDSYSWVEAGDDDPTVDTEIGSDPSYLDNPLPSSGRMQEFVDVPEDAVPALYREKSRPTVSLTGRLSPGAAISIADLFAGGPYVFVLEEDAPIRGLRRQDGDPWYQGSDTDGVVVTLSQVDVAVEITENGLVETVDLQFAGRFG